MSNYSKIKDIILKLNSEELLKEKLYIVGGTVPYLISNTMSNSDTDVKLFFKIPDKFKIPTPIGNYTPDWAVYVETENEKKLYFVIETKGSTNYLNLRDSESIKIKCGKKHFEALGQDIKFDVTKDFRNFKSKYV